MNRTVKASAVLVLGAMVALGSAGTAAAMSGSLVRGIGQSAGQSAELPLVKVRGGLRYDELRAARDGVGDLRDRGVWQAEADLYGVGRTELPKGYF